MTFVQIFEVQVQPEVNLLVDVKTEGVEEIGNSTF